MKTAAAKETIVVNRATTADTLDGLTEITNKVNPANRNVIDNQDCVVMPRDRTCPGPISAKIQISPEIITDPPNRKLMAKKIWNPRNVEALVLISMALLNRGTCPRVKSFRIA